MKKALLCFSLGIFLSGGLQAQVLYEENFNSTTGTDLPTGWYIEPDTSVSWKSGTSQSLSSTNFLIPENDGRMAAINDNAGGGRAKNGNALLVSKAYDLSGKTGVYLSVDVLFFAGRIQSTSEKLSIEASTDGTNWTVLQNVTANRYQSWEPRIIDLDTFSGKSNVMIGFRYNDAGQTMLGAAIDNFQLLIPPANDIEFVLATPKKGDVVAYGLKNTKININGVVRNRGSEPISSYTVHYQQGSSPVVSVPQTLSPGLASGNQTAIRNVEFEIPGVGEFPLKMWVTLSGDNNTDNDSATAFTAGVSKFPLKKIAFEEGTGTWCVWCPRGSVKMEEFAERMPGKATQIAVHNNDPMALLSYDQLMRSHINGFPGLIADRSSGHQDPGNILSIYNQMKDNFGFAEVRIGDVDLKESSVTVPVTITPLAELNDVKLALVVTESNVTGTGSGWAQKNAYAGGGNGEMGGYEKMPASVENVRYHFVARAITPSPQGATSGLPATLEVDKDYTATLTATLKTDWKTEDLQFIVLLIDADGKILNSDFSELPTLLPGLPVSITNVDAGILDATIYPNPVRDVAYLNVNAKDAAQAVVTVTDAMGRLVSNNIETNLQVGKNVINIPTNQLANGMYLINMTTAKGSLVFKLQVLK